MNIESAEWRNFNSYGNVTQRVDFSRTGEFYNLYGHNGGGKTTIAEVLGFALYGKVEGKTKTDLVNRTNKSMWCRVALRCKGKSVVVTRGVAPSLFDVTIDGEQVDTAGVANVQDFLETEVYELPYAVFKNVLVLRISDFKSFLAMTPADKRNIVDRLFGFSSLNQMRELVRGERRTVKEDLAEAEADVRSLLESVGAMEARLEAAVKQTAEDRERTLVELRASIKESKERKAFVDASIERLRSAAVGLVSERLAFVRDMDRGSVEEKSCRGRLELFEAGRCPYCESDLTAGLHDGVVDGLRARAEALSKAVLSARMSAEAVSAKESAVLAKTRELLDESSVVERRLNRMMADARSMLATRSDGPDAIRGMLSEVEGKVRARREEAGKAEAEDFFLSTVEGVLSDSGVKGYAMSTVLPALNQSIRETASRMHVPYEVSLNEAFDCVVTHMGEELSHRTLSTGERKKTDIAIIVALVRMLKVRYPSLNLLFLDELFVGMDAGGIYESSRLLSELCREHGMNIWVMHHAELPGDFFDRQVTAVKDAGFSRIEMSAVQ